MSDSDRKYAEIIARAWTDPNFSSLLKSDPRRALGEVGMTVPDDIELRVLIDDGSKVHLVIPLRPNDMTDEEIAIAVSGNPEVMRITPDEVCTGPLSSNIC